MVRIAQLSDLHLVEADHASRRGVASWRLSFLSAHRAIDAEGRANRARSALAAVRAVDPDHVVLTGDITEDGTASQFEVLAELLHASGVAPSKFTLVPGNHDVIDHAAAWERAFDGPLRAFAHASRFGEEVLVGDVAIVPVNTALHQHWLFSSGRFGPSHLHAVSSAVARCRGSGRAVVLAQHHPVTTHRNPVVHWVDGMHGHARARTLLHDEEHVYVLHGHIHRRRDRVVATSRHPQVFSASAVVDSDDPVRLYEAEGGAFKVC